MGNRAGGYKDRNAEACYGSLGESAYAPSNATLSYCNGTFDGALCWPATPASTEASLPCPPMRGFDATKFAVRICSENGSWENNPDISEPPTNGWTNFTPCYTKRGEEFWEEYGKNLNILKAIAKGTRYMEFAGLCVSFLCISVSIFILCYFRSLRCDRTRIHRNLFLAILIHVMIMLIKHTDSLIAWTTGEEVGGSYLGPKGTIFETPILCEALETVVEYTKSVTFMWMFIEGMYLHNMLVVSVFSSRPNYILYNILGWGVPIIPTAAWAISNAYLNTEDKCWFNYQLLKSFWIVEGPRIAVITVNFIFLLNIVRVLITKLRQNNSTEAQQVRKAVKAAIVLLPLLGLNNFLGFVIPPAGVIKFGIWCITSTFLISFQGFFISLLYCFLNSEVQNTVRTHWDRYQQRRGGYVAGRRRLVRTLSIFTSVTEVPNPQRSKSVVPKACNDVSKREWYSPRTPLKPPQCGPNVPRNNAYSAVADG